MKQSTKKDSKFEIKYYPSFDDEWWNFEVEKLLPYCYGKGADVGAGTRSPLAEQTRIDVDPKYHPEFATSADKIPVKDNSFDYITSLHLLEHFQKPELAIAEWLRVVKVGGYACLVIPDREFTGTADQRKAPEPGKNPMWHYSEFTYREFMIWLDKHTELSYKLIDHGPAWEGWSFYVILQKK